MMIKRIRLLALAVTSAFFLLQSPINNAQAQQGSRGHISGSVRDQSEAVVSGAKVTLINAQQAVFGTTESDAEGHFRFADVPVGTYVVEATRKDFAMRRIPAQVSAGSTTDVIAVLELIPVTDQVTVTAETGQAQDIDQVAQQVNIVSENALRLRATAVLAQVADEEAGVALQRTSSNIGAVVVRGLTEVSVYVDGVRFTNSTQRGGINTFFNLNEASSLRAVEILRGTNSAQYGSDSVGGTVQLVSRAPEFGAVQPEFHGEVNTFFTSADASFGGNTLFTYGTRRYGLLMNIASRRINTMRTGGGIDSHSAVTRFLGLPSNLFYTRLPDTAFTQYGGSIRFNYSPTDDQQFVLHYQRSQQDGSKRHDQLIGGDGNLIADVRNLMLDFFYARYLKQGIGFFDNGSFTISYNSQREERVNQGGQGNPFAAITTDKERTSVFGFSFYLDKQLTRDNTFLIGGDVYRDTVKAPSYTFEPETGLTIPSRPRVPNGARYLSYGLYIQDIYNVIPDRLRLSGALRYNIAEYRSRAANSPLVDGEPLFPDDSMRVADFSGRIGAVVTVADGINIAFNYSRGFRAPNITNLGSLGLVGVGYQVAAADVAGLGATIGTTADEDAVSTGIPVSPLVSETTNSFDLGFHLSRGRINTDLTGFLIDYNNTITRQALILPPGAVGRRLGSQTIEEQNANGTVIVPASASPVLVQVNFGRTRLMGLEYTLDLRLAKDWTFGGNFTYVHAEDRATGEPPNLGGGGVPPPLGFLRLRYEPLGKRYWIEAYSTLAHRQTRLSSLDLSDRRTGATRTESSIRNFFRRGACVRGLVAPGPDGICATGDETVLILTGETLSQVQNRVLGGADSSPLFPYIPGYGVFNIRGGMRLNENSEFSIDFENIGDKNYRGPGWGVDGPGRSVTMRYQYKF